MMKTYAASITAMLLCGFASAHSLLPANMSEQDQRLWTETLQQLQDCFSKIDPKEVSTLQQRADHFSAEVRELCLARKRAEAQKETGDFYASMMKEPAIQQAEACADKIPKQFDEFLSTPLNLSQFEGDDHHHICDHEIVPLDQYGGHRH